MVPAWAVLIVQVCTLPELRPAGIPCGPWNIRAGRVLDSAAQGSEQEYREFGVALS